MVAQQDNIKKTLNRLIGLAVVMFAFSFAMVPIYNTFCDITGLNGKIDINGQYNVGLASTGVDKSRTIIIEFDVSRNEGMPLVFKPQDMTIKVSPGETRHTAYFALNPTRRTITVQAIPSLSPGVAAKYFKKIQCFCFDKQTLKPHESANMALRFYIDKAIPKSIKRLTLSYTLFDVTNKEDIFDGDYHHS